MDLRTFLVPINGGSTDGTLLQTAHGLARALRAHAQAVFTRPGPQEVFVYTGMPPAAHYREAIAGGTSRYWMNHSDVPLFLMA